MIEAKQNAYTDSLISMVIAEGKTHEVCFDCSIFVKRVYFAVIGRMRASIFDKRLWWPYYGR